MSQPLIDRDRRGFVGNVFALKPDVSATSPQAGDDLDQLGLTISGNASDAENLTLMKVKIHIAQGGQVFVVDSRDVLETQNFAPGILLTFMQIENHFATDHERGQAFAGHLAGIDTFGSHFATT